MQKSGYMLRLNNTTATFLFHGAENGDFGTSETMFKG
jgi:hypothetical protein